MLPRRRDGPVCPLLAGSCKGRWPAYHHRARRPDGRLRLRALPRSGGGKSGLHGNTVPGNARRGRLQGKCHRKQTAGRDPNSDLPARLKGCGKSAPRARQRERHGKPHREQDQIGTACRQPQPSGAEAGRRCFRAAVRVGRARRPVTGVPDEWPSSAVAAEHRTRLTGRLAASLRTLPLRAPAFPAQKKHNKNKKRSLAGRRDRRASRTPANFAGTQSR